MEVVKVYQKKVDRTIQQKKAVSDKVRFIDNRILKTSSNIIQCGGTTDFSKALGKDDKKEHNILVYGTESAREARREDSELPEGFKQKSKTSPVGPATKGFYTADKYNNYSWRDFKWGGEANFSIFNPKYVDNNVQNDKTDNDIKEDLQTWTKGLSCDEEDKKEISNYQEELLNHPSYSPLVTYRESDDFIEHRTGYDALTVAKGKFELETRRACKFGLEYMDKKGGEIAFLLSIDGESTPGNDYDVLNKVKTTSRAGGRKGSSRVPITTSELRKAYRMNTSSIKFYDHEGSVAFEPWRTHPRVSKGISEENTTWKDYSDQRKSKYLNIAQSLGLGRECSKIKSTDEIKEKVIRELHLIYGEQLSPSQLIYSWEQEHGI